jgi:hypothetical protein
MDRALPCRALPCRALPCRALPCRALLMIREYSRPLTRADWRNSNPIITPLNLLLELCSKSYEERENRRRMRLINKTIKNIRSTEWYWMYDTIRMYGLKKYYLLYFEKYGVKYNRRINIYKIDGIKDAIDHYNYYHTKYNGRYNDWIRYNDYI